MNELQRQNLDAVMRSLYESISGPAGAPRDWARNDALYAPGARLMIAHRDPDGVIDRKLLLTGEPVAQALSVDERHDIVHGPVNATGVEQRQDVWMLQVRGRLDLGQEPIGSDHRRELGTEQLERHLAIVLRVVREVNDGHSTGAKFALLPPDNATGNFTKVVQRVPVRIQVTHGCGEGRPLRPGMSVEAHVVTR